MPSQARILLYGANARLLETRRMVLEKSGFQVYATTQLRELEKLMSAVPFELFIVGHTLSSEQRANGLTAARTLRPEMKILLLVEDSSVHYEQRNYDVLSYPDGPKALIAAARKILEEARAFPAFTQQRDTSGHTEKEGRQSRRPNPELL